MIEADSGNGGAGASNFVGPSNLDCLEGRNSCTLGCGLKSLGFSVVDGSYDADSSGDLSFGGSSFGDSYGSSYGSSYEDLWEGSYGGFHDD